MGQPARRGLRFFQRRRGEVEGRERADAAEVWGATDRGLVRERNEDQFLIATLERVMRVELSSIAAGGGARVTGWPQGRLLMVADGMGGIEGGDVASAVTIDAMAHYVFAMMPWVVASRYAHPDILGDGLRRALHECERHLREIAERKKLDPHLGTTLTIAYATWPVLHLVHVGDSRCYLLRKGTLTRLTRDHTLAQELVDQRALTEEQAAQSRFASMLTNAVGGSDEVVVDLHRFELRRGDELLLCTDGLSGALPDSRILALSSSGGSVQERVEALIGAAKAEGGEDNVTVVLARF